MKNVNVNELLKDIKKSFTIQKKVDFDELNLHFVMEPLTAMEELELLESLKDTEGTIFISELKKGTLAFALKKINDMDFSSNNVIEYEVDGKTVKESKFIFLKKHIDTWPTSLRDLLFEAFNDMQLELDNMVQSKSSFKRFNLQTNSEKIEKKTEKGVPEGFVKVEEPEEAQDDVEKLNAQVKKEEEMVNARMNEFSKTKTT